MYSLLLLNGGVGKRVASDRPKQFIRVNAIPDDRLFARRGRQGAGDHRDRGELSPGWQEESERVVREYAVRTPVRFVEAGDTRQESVAKLVEVGHQRSRDRPRVCSSDGHVATTSSA